MPTYLLCSRKWAGGRSCSRIICNYNAELINQTIPLSAPMMNPVLVMRSLMWVLLLTQGHYILLCWDGDHLRRAPMRVVPRLRRQWYQSIP